jgi:RNA polymerase sigma factor (sigma-70 family)
VRQVEAWDEEPELGGSDKRDDDVEHGSDGSSAAQRRALQSMTPMASPPTSKRRRRTRIATNPDLHAAWPEVRRTLLRSLRRQVDADTAEDICQDVAERLVSRAAPFDSVDDLTRWAQRVARNRAIDEWRTRLRRISGEPVPEQEVAVDLAGQVAHRIAIEEAAVAFKALRPEEQAALLRADHPGVDGRDARDRQRDANLRERARERLRGMVHNFPAGLGGRVTGWLRRLQPELAELGHLVAGTGLVIAILVGPPSADAPTAQGRAPADRPAPVASLAAGAVVAESPTARPVASRTASPAGHPSDGNGITGSTADADRRTLATVPTPLGTTSAGDAAKTPDSRLVCFGFTPDDKVLCTPPTPDGVDVPDVPA